ncbi:hypothetical protein LPJ61_003580 [Coemansia biformis]|uniref:TRAPP trafficking subunit Trs65-domain-containing protein n=1 Tax=Coemansia biformis TaxID=1286918 RepID=A0A9W8CXJ9_9FUNG|nr:hypothetical protein LPJ61_003580 [Coemansia biformis]
MDSATRCPLVTEHLEALFKCVRISLHIPNAAPRFSALGASRPAPRTARAVVGDGPPRRFLYRGEHVDASLVATIPNFDQVRWSLASSMRRASSPTISDGELPVSAGELEQFFAALRFTVVAYQASTVPGSGDGRSTGTGTSNSTISTISYSYNSPATPHQHLQPHDDGKTAGVAQPLKVSNIAATAVFTADIPARQPGDDNDLSAERLDSGTWCCVYPWPFTVPAIDEPPESHADSALMFEIYATWQDDVGSLLSAGDGQRRLGGGGISTDEARLEELATRLSSEILATANLERSQQSALRVAELDWLSLETAMAAPLSTASQKLVQILVPTYPVVGISTRTVQLPHSYGADAALVEVGVRYDAATAGLALRSIDLRSSEWHVQALGAPLQSLPLTTGTSCQAVFKVTLFATSASEAPLGGLRLLNGAGAPGGGTASLLASDSKLSVLVRIGSADTEAPDATLLDISHRVPLPGQPAHRSLPAPQDGTTPAMSGTAMTSSTAPSISLPSTRSGRSLDATTTSITHVPRSEMHGPLADGSMPAAAGSHMRTASLDYDLNARVRKYSLTYPSVKQLPAESTAPRSSEQRARAGSKHPPPGMLDQGLLSAQRSRAATVNAAACVPRSITGAYAHAARDSLSAMHPVPAASRGQASERGSAEMVGAAAQRRRSSLYHALGAEPIPKIRPGTPGELGIAFEAPPRVLLGSEVAVRMCVSNNTDSFYPYLALVDDSASDYPAGGDDVDQPGARTACGLFAAASATAIPPLSPGESVSATLKYTAAAPHFHAAGPLRLLSLDAGAPGMTLAVLDAPFVVFVDDST